MHVATDYIGKLRLPISPERLESYRPAAGTDLDTVVNYFWNLCLCEALYPSLNAAEISLRNSIHTALSSHYQNDYWFDDENVVESRQYQQVLKARETLRHREKEETAGRIVAELTFGFWVGLLNRPYEAKTWAPNGYDLLRKVFPHAPRRARKLKFLRDRFYEINLLRNRVFRYEPVWNRPQLDQTHSQILEAIGWISPEKKAAIALFDRFPEVHWSGRAKVEAELKKYLGLP